MRARDNGPARPAFLAALLLACIAASGGVAAAELRIVFGQYTPPYVFENGTGIVVDIVRTALESGGHTMTPVYAPIERALRMFAERKVDGTTIIREEPSLKAEYSADFMQYHNRAFVLKSRNLAIRGLDDLKDKSVVGFQNAREYLGAEFGRAVAGNKRYKEMAQQEAQTHMLLLGRIDVAIMDESIFRYYRHKLVAERKAAPAQEYVAYDIFPPTPYKAAFVDSKVRADFDKAIAAMRKDGRYEAIYRKYERQYFPVRR